MMSVGTGRSFIMRSALSRIRMQSIEMISETPPTPSKRASLANADGDSHRPIMARVSTIVRQIGAGGFASVVSSPARTAPLPFHKGLACRGQAHDSFREFRTRWKSPRGPSPVARRAFPVVARGSPTASRTMKVLLWQHLPSGICARDVRLITL
jgi:hypothetical protein